MNGSNSSSPGSKSSGSSSSGSGTGSGRATGRDRGLGRSSWRLLPLRLFLARYASSAVREKRRWPPLVRLARSSPLSSSWWMVSTDTPR